MIYPEAIAIGDTVRSDFTVLDGIDCELPVYIAPRIAIAASMSFDELGASDYVRRYWRAIGAPDALIWQPGSAMSGTRFIAGALEKGRQACMGRGLLLPGTVFQVRGEVLSYGENYEEPPATEHDDRLPHVDFIPPNPQCAVLLGSNRGGTVGWRGAFTYRGNLVASYAAETQGMQSRQAKVGEFMFSPDARSFIHARGAKVINQARSLIRLFFGPGEI